MKKFEAVEKVFENKRVLEEFMRTDIFQSHECEDEEIVISVTKASKILVCIRIPVESTARVHRIEELEKIGFEKTGLTLV